LSRVRGAVTNNNGFWIGRLDLLPPLLQSLLITIKYNNSQSIFSRTLDCRGLAPFSFSLYDLDFGLCPLSGDVSKTGSLSFFKCGETPNLLEPLERDWLMLAVCNGPNKSRCLPPLTWGRKYPVSETSCSFVFFRIRGNGQTKKTVTRGGNKYYKWKFERKSCKIIILNYYIFCDLWFLISLEPYLGHSSELFPNKTIFIPVLWFLHVAYSRDLPRTFCCLTD
jgi:hypothetical protein